MSLFRRPGVRALLLAAWGALAACTENPSLTPFLDRVHAEVLLNAPLPTDPDAERARTLLREGAPHDAALVGIARLQADPAADDLAGLAEALQQLDRLELAAEAWRLAGELDQRFAGADTLLRRADLLRNAKDFAGSRVLARAYREKAEGPAAIARGHLAEGLAFQDEVRLDEAIACYRRAGELTPDDPGLWLKRGQVHALKGETDAARTWFEKVLQRSPNDRQALFDLGRHCLEAGELARGVELLEKVVQQDPRHRRAVYQLASAYRRLRQEERAEQLLERFERLEAQANAEHAGKMDREAVTILFERARSAFEQGDRETARATLQQLLEIDPSHEAARDLLRRASEGGGR